MLDKTKTRCQMTQSATIFIGLQSLYQKSTKPVNLLHTVPISYIIYNQRCLGDIEMVFPPFKCRMHTVLSSRFYISNQNSKKKLPILKVKLACYKNK